MSYPFYQNCIWLVGPIATLIARIIYERASITLEVTYCPI